MEHAFTDVYNRNVWGNNNNSEYNGSSGGGSSVEYNKDTYIPFLKKFIGDHNIKRVVDIGCGDFRCGTLIYDDLNVTYMGYDVYKNVVASVAKAYSDRPKYCFRHLDVCANKEQLVRGDLCILKDILQHWSVANITTFLDYLIASKKFKYILICNSGDQAYDNIDIKDGDWRKLGSKFLPLKNYNPTVLYSYGNAEDGAKEVSLITVE
jgi:hypothetical protein